MNRKRDRRSLFRLALSAFILWHGFVVLIAPNNALEAQRDPNSFLSHYIKLLGVGSYWSFFAPEPGPPPLYAEWEIEGENRKLIDRSQWPLDGSPYFFRDRQNRRIAFASYLTTTPLRVEKVLTPYLCRKFPDAHVVRLWRAREEIPSMKQIRTGERKLRDPQNRIREWAATMYCARDE